MTMTYVELTFSFSRAGTLLSECSLGCKSTTVVMGMGVSRSCAVANVIGAFGKKKRLFETT